MQEELASKMEFEVSKYLAKLLELKRLRIVSKS